MTIIGKHEDCLGDFVAKEVRDFVGSISGRGHFGTSDDGVFVATFGNVEIPDKIKTEMGGRE